MRRVLEIVERIWIFLFARPLFRKFNLALNHFSFVGLGVGFYQNQVIQDSETALLRLLSKVVTKGDLVIDVGANVGHYAIAVRKILGAKVRIVAIDPAPDVFQALSKTAIEYGFEALCLGCGSKGGRARLYDHRIPGTEHASLYRDVFRRLHKTDFSSTSITLDTLDHLSQRFAWRKIRLLKIDAEGSELEILKGARRLLDRDAIDYIQIEFNEMNLISRVSMQDLMDFLPGFDIFRLLSTGLIPLSNLAPLYRENYGYQNLVAIRRSMANCSTN